MVSFDIAARRRPHGPRSATLVHVIAAAVWLAASSSVLGCAHLEPRERAGPWSTAGFTVEALEARIHQLVNDERRRAGLTELGWTEALRPIARGHSGHMQRRGYFSHAAPNGDVAGDRYRRARFECRVPAGSNRILTSGENLYLGHTVRFWLVEPGGASRVGERHSLESLARAAVDGWMGSRSHRENLLGRYWRTEAIGAVIAPDGRVYVTQNFC